MSQIDEDDDVYSEYTSDYHEIEDKLHEIVVSIQILFAIYFGIWVHSYFDKFESIYFGSFEGGV